MTAAFPNTWTRSVFSAAWVIGPPARANGDLFAGAIAGATAAVGFGGVFWVCAALSAVAGGLLLASLSGPVLLLPVA